MSFITKRERVFNEYELFDLPPRNEGKLKAYASCTDARAWSHFCSDKAEHLVEIIKRNNETVRPKYIPTDVIVDTLMATKNAEIARLKQKIEEFEQLLAAYDQLDLSCDQKCEIANAHAAIKAANKELDDLCLELDLSGYTEALESEVFETGKSRGDGDEVITPKTYDFEEQETSQKTETKSVQMGTSCTCDIGTIINDPRIDEMQDLIINKDAKLNSMKNTIAVMENDLREPYCIYANIYTALEKIFAILCQNEKYRQYLKLMIAGKDLRCVGIKSKILIKLKILEKFCSALIVPCNRQFSTPNSNYDSICYRSEVSETNFALTSVEAINNNDNKRAHLVADIIENDEMKEILSKDSFSVKNDADLFDDGYTTQAYNIETENLQRLKKLQENFDDLMVCYESLKHDQEFLEERCRKYAELEKEFEYLKLQIQEYNALWNEKEHYRNRSTAVDNLKEQFLILSDKNINLETQLKAETEINHIKCKAIEDLRKENFILEKKLNEALLEYEKEKNSLMCKLKEADCRAICQSQQIKSLSVQIDRLLEQDQQSINTREAEENSIALIDELETQRDQIKNLKEALFYNEEEKHNIQQQYQDQLKLINDLKIEVEDWKSTYEKTMQRNDYLEKYTESLREQTNELSQDLEEKKQAEDNLIKMNGRKSQEIDKLLSEVEKRKTENKSLLKQINELRNRFNENIETLKNEKLQALKALQLAKEESQKLMNKVKDYDQIVHSKARVTKYLEIQPESKQEFQTQLFNAADENISLKINLASRENSNSILLQEIQQLHEVNKFALDNINSLQDENNLYKTSVEVTQKESNELKMKLSHFENLVAIDMQNLRDSHEKLIKEKKNLEKDLLHKSHELEEAIQSTQLSKRKSDELLDKLHQCESHKDDLIRINEAHQKLNEEKYTLERDLLEKKKELEELQQSLNDIKSDNKRLLNKCKQIDILESELLKLKRTYDELLTENDTLQKKLNNRIEEFEKLQDILDKKIEENQNLNERIKSLESNHLKAESSIKILIDDNVNTQAKLKVIKKESSELTNKINYYETLETEFHQLQKSHNLMRIEKETLQSELAMQLANLKRMKNENIQLNDHSQNIISHNDDLEKALICTRSELIKSTTLPDHPYENIVKEIEEMRQEKLANQQKIRSLRDKQDEYENLISSLSDDVMARDDRIAILQNHINKLQDEVRHLNKNLSIAVDTGEQMRDFSLEIKNMEAHHSKATHNMKIELAKLQQQNAKLEKNLSVTSLKSDESFENNRVLMNEIENLENEREIIITNIKEIEIKVVGDSPLGPVKHDTNDILVSLERIRKSFDVKNTKNISLEHTILKLQTSSQLLLSKAEEATRLVEKEKQKIINEKEEAIKSKINMEKQLLELRDELEKQRLSDRARIKDLEATISSQELLMQRINNGTQKHIEKLKDELQNLENIYQSSVEENGRLHSKLENLRDDRNSQIEMLNKAKADLVSKSKEICVLQEELEKIKSKMIVDIGVQTDVLLNSDDIETQTDKEFWRGNKIKISFDEPDNAKSKIADDVEQELNIQNVIHFKSENNRHIQEEEQTYCNEVQILTANVEPTFDCKRSNYFSSLGTRRLENGSVSVTSENERSSDQSIIEICTKSKNDPNLIDIYEYNKQSLHTDSSRVDEFIENSAGGREGQGTAFIEFTNSDKTVVDINSDSRLDSLPENKIICKVSQYSNDIKDLENVKWLETVPETATGYPKKEENIHTRSSYETFLSGEEQKQKNEYDSVRLKLQIKMPRVHNESDSLLISSDGEKSHSSNTVDRYTTSRKCLSTSDTNIFDDENRRETKSTMPSLAIYNEESLHIHEDVKENVSHRDIFKMIVMDSDSNTSNKARKLSKKTWETPNFETNSQHKLSRVEAKILLLDNDKSLNFAHNSASRRIGAFGLDYILDTVQDEVNHIKSSPQSQERQTVTDDKIFNTINDHVADFNILKSNDSKARTSEYKIYATVSKSSSKSNNTYTERGIMAKLDKSSDYENRIKYLTKTLENIEKDHKKKIEVIKVQYNNNIRSIINEHNLGVKSIQNLHEDALDDIIKTHENEIENLRSMSIEAMRRADLLEKENHVLKIKVKDCGNICLDEEPIKMQTQEVKRRKKHRGDAKSLTKTIVEAFNVKPKSRVQGPCTCSLDINLSDTIRNIFEQVDVEQRKMAENTYMKYVANKIMSGNMENLDAQELSFLHLKVCRMWKSKLLKEEALQKRIDSLETELMNKQRNAQQHIAELDRKVSEERRRLQEVREAVCRSSDQDPRTCNPDNESKLPHSLFTTCTTHCPCKSEVSNVGVSVVGSAGDLTSANLGIRPRQRNTRNDKNRTIYARSSAVEGQEKRLYSDEPPTRLRRSHDRQIRAKK